MWPDALETQELLIHARDGDAAARDRLLERHRAALRRMVDLRMDARLRQRVDASDIVQDALVDAHRRLAEYAATPGVPFHLWLRGLVRDRLVDAQRWHRGAQKRSVNREEAPRWTSDEQSALDLVALARNREMTPAAAAIYQELQARFQAAVETLDELDREVILMRHFEQLSNQEVAAALDLSEPAAGMRYLRAMRKLRSLLDVPNSQDGAP